MSIASNSQNDIHHRSQNKMTVVTATGAADHHTVTVWLGLKK